MLSTDGAPVLPGTDKRPAGLEMMRASPSPSKRGGVWLDDNLIFDNELENILI
jgi:hypothetical protein